MAIKLHDSFGVHPGAWLRADGTRTGGGRRGWKAFHDRFLSYGGPPIPLVRAQMMGEGRGRCSRRPAPRQRADKLVASGQRHRADPGCVKRSRIRASPGS